MSPFRSLLLLTCLLVAAGCAPGERTASETLFPLMEAVQSEDLDALYCTLTGAAGSTDLGGDEAERRDNFEAWARAHYEAYLDGRDEGRIELEDNPIRVIRLFALGRGTFFKIVAGQRVAEDALLVRTEIHFGYPQIDLSRLSPGTTFYVSAAPPGRVHAVRVPSVSREVSLDVLSTLELEWTLVESAPVGECPGGWTVASVRPVEDSATSIEITWAF